MMKRDGDKVPLEAVVYKGSMLILPAKEAYANAMAWNIVKKNPTPDTFDVLKSEAKLKIMETYYGCGYEEK